MEIKYLKSATRLLNRDYVNRQGLDLSKEVPEQQSYQLSKLEVKKNNSFLLKIP